MTRFAIIVCVSMIIGTAAKPYGPSDRKVEVEPPENKADAPYHIDPNMKIWMTGQVQSLASHPVPLSEDARLYLEPEEDRDHINHPAFINIAPEQAEPVWDGVYHKARYQLDPLIAEAEPRAAHSAPEADKDDLYHRDDQLYLQPAPPVQMEPPRGEARRHLQPEEDKDALYHRDVPELEPQDEPKADGVLFSASQRKYSEPEEDRDGLYHQ
ncbi:uncharacterized protein si:ch211-217g15.3 isoform X2 [Betta splendens]|uniref:Uncharacterized protein si:ch211-217g15.3 isoform X2 n=1 Tax=Betta splendens TaxID=158456 RepID=A0A6P7KJI0_BETSP|nr:uncharacterized protein si:ch211-217g15.3 isoform X2 [Betta splendens]